MTGLSSTVFAQFDKGQVAGFVRDQKGAVISAASVKITNTLTKLERTATTNDSGYYVQPDLLPGDYEVSVEAPGFKKFTQTNVKVDAASKVSIDVTLEAGAITESITVVSGTALVERDSAQVAKTIESRDVQDLMLNGRSPLSLAMLKAGIRGITFDSFRPDDLGNGFNVNGSRNDENLITIDGVIATRTRASGAVLGVFNVDAIQEVKILASNYLPEYGRSSGGQVRMVTKGGGQAFHGDAFEFFRNSALDANSWIRNTSTDRSINGRPAPFRFNQFGFDLGGPAFIPRKLNKERDKLFFFWAEEWIRWRQEGTNTGTVPTQAMRQGDFSELLNPSNLFYGKTVVIKDPSTGQPFSGNRIPPNKLSANGIALMNTFPLPTPGFRSGSSNWIGTSPNPRDTRKDTVRVDYHPDSNDQISFSGTLFKWISVDSFRGTFDLARTDWSRPNRTSALSWTRTISPTLINEFTFGASEDLVFINVFNNGKYQRTTYGITYPFIFPGSKDIENKIPTLQASNFSTVDGGPYPAKSKGPIFTWSDNVTKLHGRHTLKAGVFFEYSGENDLDQINVQPLPGNSNNQNGTFQFTDSRSGGTGAAISNMAMGLFTNYAEISRKSYTPWRALATDIFAQDSWKVRDNLTLELGMRYSLWPPWHSLWNNIAEFNPAFYNRATAAVVDRGTGAIISGDRFDGIVLPGNGFPSSAVGRVAAASDPQFQRLFHDLPDGFSQTHKNVFEPRLGVAYSLNQKTVVRAGAGIFHNRVTLNDSTLLGGNAPIQFQVGASNGVADAPTGAQQRNFPLAMTMQDPVFKHPTSYQYSLSIQRELPSSITVEVAYVGRVGLHLQRERNINQLLPGTKQANPGVNVDALRPYQGFGIIRLSENAGHSNYNGLQVTVDRRFRSGLAFGASYTLSKITSNTDNKRDLLFNTFDDHGFRAISDLDRTHLLNLYYIYEFPFWREQDRLYKKVAGGWQISGVTVFQSGQPLSVWRGDDVAGVGDNFNQPWNVVGDTSVAHRAFSNAAGDNNFYFNPKAFAEPKPGTFGNAGRNILRGPGFQSWDIALFKNIRAGERVKTQLRWEVFNFLNHPNWNNPDTNPKSSTFGQVTQKNGNRQMQVAFKLSF
jgi:hypothetical protein